MRDELVVALTAWEEGALNTDELHTRFPDDDVHSLLALHSSLETVAIAAPAFDADRVWALIAERLSQPEPSLLARALDLLRRPAIAIAASVLLGGGVAYAADIGPVREGVDAVVQEIGRVFGFGSDGDRDGGRSGSLEGPTESPGTSGSNVTARQDGGTDGGAVDTAGQIQPSQGGDDTHTISGEVGGRGTAADGSDGDDDSLDDGVDDGSEDDGSDEGSDGSDSGSDGATDDGTDDGFEDGGSDDGTDDVVDVGDGSDDGTIGDVDDIGDDSGASGDSGDSGGGEGSGDDDQLIDDPGEDGSDNEDKPDDPDEPDDTVVRALTFERAR